MQGWIKLHRQIQEHWIFKEKRTFSKFEAWIDILLSANHEDKKIVLGNDIIEVKRGSFITSELKLMNRWGWGKEKTRKFLKLLEEDGMIVKKSDRKKTVINICNYSVFQDFKNEIRPQTDHNQTDNGLITDTNKNVKNDKKEKNVSSYSDEFDSFWSIYPRKVDKKKAHSSFKRAIKHHPIETILSGTRKYANSVKNTDIKFIKHASTFLNNESFLDGYDQTNVYPLQQNTAAMEYMQRLRGEV